MEATIVGARPIGPTLGDEGGEVPSLAFFVELVARNLKEISVRLIDSDLSNKIFERDFELPIESENEDDETWEAHTLLVLGFRGLKFPAPGTFLLQARPLDGDWSTIREVYCPHGGESSSS